MIRVLQICPDASATSGINTFCTQLDRHLQTLGVMSRIARSMADWDATADVVHIHELWLRFPHEAAVRARSLGLPVVWSTHGMTAPWSMQHKWWKKWPAWWLYQRRDLKRAAVLHVTSDQEAAWNVRLGLDVPSVTVPLGTDLPDLTAGGTCDAAPVRTILFVGRIYPVKGLANLVRAAALLQSPATSHQPPLTFRIVGPDQAGHQSKLQALARELGVADRFVWPGAKFGSELDAEYAACDALVLPSFTENFGGVVVDALAHGKPVIASKFTPWRELEEKGCGWWVENSPERLAEAIRIFAETPVEVRAEMGRRGRSLVESAYSWPSVARQMMACYERVLKRGGRD